MAFTGKDFSFLISPEELDENGKDIIELCNKMRSSLEEIKSSINTLDSWHSENKAKYEARIKNALPKMFELVDVIESYGGVARQTSSRIVNTENKISQVLNS